MLQPSVDVPGVEALEAGEERGVAVSILLFELVRVSPHGSAAIQQLPDVGHEEQDLQHQIDWVTRWAIRQC